MDRFIASLNDLLNPSLKKFKIQYGQIYSPRPTRERVPWTQFKIQYGQIYRCSSSIVSFICLLFKIQYGQIYRQLDGYTTVPYWHLKSNMDRFIVRTAVIFFYLANDLKSNMDRFIGLRLYPFDIDKKLFKIQYGQIYRRIENGENYSSIYLKSNMDRFIEFLL